MYSLAQMLLMACILTIIIEAVLARLLFKVSLFEDFIYIALVNIFTNISLNLILYMFNLYFYVLILEIIVILVEFILYKLYWKEKKVLELFLFSFILNFDSYIFGVLFF